MKPAGLSLALASALSAFTVAQAAPLAPAATASSVAGPSRPLADACPAQLPVRQTVSEPIADWTSIDQQGSYPFTRVAFFPGPPADTALIVPTVEYKGQAGLHDRWELPRRAGGYWMTCAYANTTAVLSRKLADDADYCEADYDGRFMTLVVKHWACGNRRTMAPSAWTRPGARSSTGKGPAKPAAPPVRRGG